ncbi:MAG: glycosyltransferase family 2 protein [Planctomycetota bacterium]|jgi:glycosyltransferase involved in cell wall biosynthesis
MISVIIPAYDAGLFINRTIDSILVQTLPADEIIVVDDGSIDNTAEVAKSYGSKVRYIYQQNAGDAAARNTGITAAKGDWIAFLDHDDEWLPDKLQLQMELLNRNPQLLWCASNRYQSDGMRKVAVGNVTKIQKALEARNFFEDYFTVAAKGICPVLTSTMLIRKDVFEQVGNFDPFWIRCADLDMWWRIAYKFPSIGYLAEPLVLIHLDVENVVSTGTRLKGKRGLQSRELIAKHLEMAKQNNCLRTFEPYARRILIDKIFTMLYHGFKQDTRDTVKQFSAIVPSYCRLAVYLLSIFPKATSTAAKSAAYLVYRLGLERQVTRRWLRRKKTNTK